MHANEAQRWLWHLWTALPGWVAPALAISFLSGLAVAALGRRGPDVPYVAAESLLTPAERAFFLVLRQALADDYHLFAKVRLGDILQIERGVEGKRRYAAFGRISSKHADFVACDPRTFAVRGVIELDDRSHQRPDRQARDKFFDAAMAAARVPVLRVPAQRRYSSKELREQARELFNET